MSEKGPKNKGGQQSSTGTPKGKGETDQVTKRTVGTQVSQETKQQVPEHLFWI